MLARARERVRAPIVRFARHDVRHRWPASDASLDVVIGDLVLEHLADLAPVYTEAARVLRPGGRLFVCELHPFRQWRGAGARFTDAATGQEVRVAAHVHTVAEYVNGGIAAGLVLRSLGEWLEPDAASDLPPRLLSVLFGR
jgi:malonyl-CoA O-methyltransferase